MSTSRVLIVEDQRALVDLVVQALAGAGIAADTAATTSQAVACVAIVPYAALVLDRGLPDGEGLAWLRRLRADGINLPCLVLTARDALHDRVDGLNAGADDYLAKPFEMDELVARVRALLRRQAQWVPSTPTFGDLTVEPIESRLRTRHATVTLAPAELQLMIALVRAEGRVVRRSTLEAAAWGVTEAVTPNALDVALHRLRRKLALVQSRLELHNTKGVGYALVATD